EYALEGYKGGWSVKVTYFERVIPLTPRYIVPGRADRMISQRLWDTSAYVKNVYCSETHSMPAGRVWRPLYPSRGISNLWSHVSHGSSQSRNEWTTINTH